MFLNNFILLEFNSHYLIHPKEKIIQNDHHWDSKLYQ